MSSKIGLGSTKNNRDSHSKRLGIKCIENQYVKCGYIIIRQKGQKYKPGRFVGSSKNHTLYAKTDGFLNYTTSGLVNIIKYNI